MDCRLCGGPLRTRPALHLPGMPPAAQSFVDSPRQAGRLVDLDVRQCEACGLVQLDAEPVPYYKSVVTAARWSEEMLAFRARQAEAFVERFGLAGHKVIEIGCGGGYYLDLLEKAGAHAYGLEHGAMAVAEARAAGRRVARGYPTDLHALPDGPFDAFVCINFLEHAPEPRRFLAAIASKLADNAVGLVEVPSLETAIARLRYYDFVGDHLSYFTRRTLTFALEGTGFEVLECAPAWHDDDLVAFVRRRPRADFTAWAIANPVVAEFRQLVAHPAYRRIAIWGASHQALTLIALARPERLDCLVDSSPAKQGRFEPTLGLPVLPPSALAERGVDTVLVMAAGYSDEVADILLHRMSFAGTVAVLRETRFEIMAEGR